MKTKISDNNHVSIVFPEMFKYILRNCLSMFLPLFRDFSKRSASVSVAPALLLNLEKAFKHIFNLILNKIPVVTTKLYSKSKHDLLYSSFILKTGNHA